MLIQASADWELEFERFIAFGTLLDRKTRGYLVEYLKHKMGMGDKPSPVSINAYLSYFTDALDALFGDSLLQLMQERNVLARQVSKETLKWMRRIYTKLEKRDPFVEEKDRIAQWASTPPERFAERWSVLLGHLENEYPRRELDSLFYKDKFSKLLVRGDISVLSTEEREEVELLLNDMLARWDACVQAKVLAYQIKHLDNAFQEFKASIDERVEEFERLTNLLGPVAEYLGRSWDMSRSLWKETSFDVLAKYQDLLENEDSVKQLVDILGKMREAEIELEEESFEKVIIRKEWIEDPTIRNEIDGVHESNDLSSLLSSEVGLLATPETETAFMKRFAEENLQTFQYEARRLVTSHDNEMETYNKVKEKEKGPFIICVDTSDSMSGTPEHIAKVICFAILKMAAEENRRAFLVNFSVGIQVLDLHDISRSLDDIAKFLQMSFYSGTSITLALIEVLRQLETEAYEDADVLVISDFIMYRVEDDVLERMRKHQLNNGTQFHCLTMSDEPLEQLLPYFDSNWLYDPKEKGIIRELTRELRTIQDRKTW